MINQKASAVLHCSIMFPQCQLQMQHWVTYCVCNLGPRSIKGKVMHSLPHSSILIKTSFIENTEECWCTHVHWSASTIHTINDPKITSQPCCSHKQQPFSFLLLRHNSHRYHCRGVYVRHWHRISLSTPGTSELVQYALKMPQNIHCLICTK